MPLHALPHRVLQLMTFASEMFYLLIHTLRQTLLNRWLLLLLNEFGFEAVVERLHELLALHCFVLQVRQYPFVQLKFVNSIPQLGVLLY